MRCIFILYSLFLINRLFASDIVLCPSWTIPVIEICTQNRDSIKSKDEYISATFKIVKNKEGGESDVFDVSIKGRGNSTWKYFDKKPYKLKFGKKIDLVGGGKSKHYALINFCDNEYAYWDNLVGFELSRRLGMTWTPSMMPVELILNDDYLGLYFIVENIRVEKSRVNIVEQDNGEDDEAKVSGGWLLEINNYYEDNQIYLKDNEDNTLKIQYHSPDSLSETQLNYLANYLTIVNESVNSYDIDNSGWHNFIDGYELAKYYIVQECIDNPEGFRGSCWMYKDIGDNSKLKFGPIWDLGAGNYWRNEPRFITDGFVVLGHKYKQFWITEILKSNHFKQILCSMWENVRNKLDIDEYVITNYEEIKAAIVNDHMRWPQYDYAYTKESMEKFLQWYKMKTDFLDSQWHDITGIINIENQKAQLKISDDQVEFTNYDCSVINVTVTNMNGIVRKLAKIGHNRYSISPLSKGLYCISFTIGNCNYKQIILVN